MAEVVDGNILFCDCDKKLKDGKPIHAGTTNEKHANHIFLKHQKYLSDAIVKQLKTNKDVKLNYWDTNGYVNLNLPFGVGVSVNCCLCFHCNKIFYSQSVSFAHSHRTKDGAKRTLTKADKLEKHNLSKGCSVTKRVNAFKQFITEYCKNADVLNYVFGDEKKPKIEEKQKRGRKPATGAVASAVAGAGVKVTLKDSEYEERDIRFFRSYYHLMKAKVTAYEAMFEQMKYATNNEDYPELSEGVAEVEFKILLKTSSTEYENIFINELKGMIDEDEEMNFIDLDTLEEDDKDLIISYGF